jgi:hypothetical protein
VTLLSPVGRRDGHGLNELSAGARPLMGWRPGRTRHQTTTRNARTPMGEASSCCVHHASCPVVVVNDVVEPIPERVPGAGVPITPGPLY